MTTVIYYFTRSNWSLTEPERVGLRCRSRIKPPSTLLNVGNCSVKCYCGKGYLFYISALFWRMTGPLVFERGGRAVLSGGLGRGKHLWHHRLVLLSRRFLREVFGWTFDTSHTADCSTQIIQTSYWQRRRRAKAELHTVRHDTHLGSDHGSSCSTGRRRSGYWGGREPEEPPCLLHPAGLEFPTPPPQPWMPANTHRLYQTGHRNFQSRLRGQKWINHIKKKHNLTMRDPRLVLDVEVCMRQGRVPRSQCDFNHYLSVWHLDWFSVDICFIVKVEFWMYAVTTCTKPVEPKTLWWTTALLLLRRGVEQWP